MAKPIGTMFVELSLDDKVYKQRLGEILTSTETTAKGIETSWKALGTKSAESFDKQRLAAENAYTLIAKSTMTAKDDIIRAEEAKNAKLKALDTQQFGSQTSFIESLKSHWMAATAIIYSAIRTIGKAWDMVKAGAEYDEQFGILDNLAKKYSRTADSIIADMKRASDGQIANADLMSVALAGVAKGLQPEQLINLADAARILGDAVGKNATEALKDLTEALEAGRVKGLKGYLGSAIDLKDAFGDLEGKLTATEKAQAMYNMTMIHASKLQSEQIKNVDDTADKIEKLEAKWKNATTAASQYFKIVAVELFFNAKWAVGDISDETIREAQGNYLRLPMPARPKDIGSYQAKLDDLKKELQLRKDTEQAIKDEEVARKKMTEEAERAEKKHLEIIDENAMEEARIYDWIHDYELKLYADKYRAEEDMAAKQLKEEEDNAKLEIQQTGDRLQAYRSMYKELGELSKENYEFQRELLDKQYDEYVRLTGNEALAAEWLAKKKKELLREETLAYGSFFDGIKQGFADLADATKSWAQRSHDIVMDMAKTSKSTLSDVLFDGITGKLKTFADYWESIWSSMLRTTTNMIADFAVSAGTSLARDLFGAAGSAAGNWGGDLIDWLFGAQGLWNIASKRGDEVPVIAHEGEMIIPRTTANYLRATYGDFAGMMGGADLLGGTTGAGVTGPGPSGSTGIAGRFGSDVAGWAALGALFGSATLAGQSLIGFITAKASSARNYADDKSALAEIGSAIIEGAGEAWGFGGEFSGGGGEIGGGVGNFEGGGGFWEKGTGPAGLPRTGLFYGHEGEIVLNPAQSKSVRGSGGSPGTERPIYITVEVAGDEFEAIIQRVSDNVRVKAERRAMGVKRMYS